ncbi:oxidoreductase [Ensifer sp. Root31]|uniref:NAD(P)/FAD-dependent oxidoreductase n=1 Tax=Ensifer sp. Root31 TaxID=1736512 RepID=UPI00070B587A|nr:FAD-binding oxidoreductase [Ensifer sp. Root31]KQU74664.1 oxidoreductase [Ensifer sp. Root31]
MAGHVRTWDLIVIGGGIVGCAAALYAARMGMSCLIIERDMIGSAQSGRNLGFVRQQARDFRELPLMMASMRIWEGIEADLGRSVGWHQGGNISLAMNETGLAERREWQRRGREEFGLDTRILTAAETFAILPNLSRERSVTGAMYTPSDGKAEPARATRAFFEAALELGVAVCLGEAVRLIETGGGRTVGVWVGGRFYRSDTVICAAGAGSAALLRSVGLDLPQERIRATVARTERSQVLLPQCVSGPSTGIRQDANGAFLLSVAGGEYDVRFDSWRHMRKYADARRGNPEAAKINYLAPLERFWPRRVPAPLADIPPSRDYLPPETKRAQQAQEEFQALFPDIGDVALTTIWAGVIDTLPDMIPALGPVTGVEGLLVATGFSGHGFGPGPMAGMIMANLAAGRPASVDTRAISPDRFQRALN